MVQRCRKEGRMEDQKPGLGMACNLDFAKEKDSNQNFKRFRKFSKLGDVVAKPVQPKCITGGGLGASRGQFFVIFLKK